MNTIKTLLILLLLGTLTACGTPTVSLKLTAQKRLNQDDDHSLPVLVRVYTLKSRENFTDATFRELWRDDKRILRSSLVSRREISLSPGATRKITLSKHAHARYIGVVALFRHPYGGHWRAVMPMPNAVSGLFGVSVTLSGSTIQFK